MTADRDRSVRKRYRDCVQPRLAKEGTDETTPRLSRGGVAASADGVVWGKRPFAESE
jgi:hypothetical protein